MNFVSIKNSVGKTYVYLRKSQRINGISVCIFSLALGTADHFIYNLFSWVSIAYGISPIDTQEISRFGSLFIAKQVIKYIDISVIIDNVINDKDKCKTLPTTGKFFEYAILNRMISANSKNKMPIFLNQFDTETLFPEIQNVTSINSQNFWDKFNNVDEEKLDIIKYNFFNSVQQFFKSTQSECFALDNTNIYTCFDRIRCHCSLAKYGHSKEGRDNHLIIGLALLVDRTTKIPFDYVAYPGNIHDSKELFAILPDIIKSMKMYRKDSVTICFDKGMNSPANIDIIDSDNEVHFITAYSPYYAEDLTNISTNEYSMIDDSNSRLNKLLFYESKKVLWDKERRVIVTYNKDLYRRQYEQYVKRVLEFREDIKEIKKYFKQNVNVLNINELKKNINLKLEKLYTKHHLPKDLYNSSFDIKSKLELHIKINVNVEKQYISKFGKNIIVTDIFNWSANDIINASKDRNIVEESFRILKNNESIRPIYHWTDSKVKCHIFCCIAALVYIRILENKVRKSIKDITATSIIEEMDKLKVSNTAYKGFKNKTKFFSIKGDDSKVKSILDVFGYNLKHGELLKIGEESNLESLLKLLKINDVDIDFNKGQEYFIKRLNETLALKDKSSLKKRTQSNFIFSVLWENSIDNSDNKIISNSMISMSQNQNDSNEKSSVFTTSDIISEISPSPICPLLDQRESNYLSSLETALFNRGWIPPDRKRLSSMTFLSTPINTSPCLPINTSPSNLDPSNLSKAGFFLFNSGHFSIPNLLFPLNQNLTCFGFKPSRLHLAKINLETNKSIKNEQLPKTKFSFSEGKSMPEEGGLSKKSSP